MKTELVWEGKYDEFGNRREVDVAGSSMPMQKIETIDQPRSEAASKGGEFLLDFEKTTSRNDDFRNRLVWGDNKLVMASLLKELRGSIDLIYIDPPFDVGADFSTTLPIGDEGDNVQKDQSTLEMVAYRDMWGRGADSYLQMMSERLSIMRELLSDVGSIYVHCDWHVAHYLRAVLDDVFGVGGETGDPGFRNEIVWKSTRHTVTLADTAQSTKPSCSIRRAKTGSGMNPQCRTMKSTYRSTFDIPIQTVDGSSQGISVPTVYKVAGTHTSGMDIPSHGVVPRKPCRDCMTKG